MPKKSLNFEPGDILILELPFTDLIGKKLRPVLVLSSKELNQNSNDLIVAKISSSRQLNEYEIELNLEDLEEGKGQENKLYSLPFNFYGRKSVSIQQSRKNW